SGGVTSFFARALKFDNYQLSAGRALNFTVTTSPSDSGPGSGNTFQVQDGINLRIKPQNGDLQGTTVADTAPSVPSVQITHIWAAEDRGPSAAGFSNNVSVGTLALSSLSP